MSISYIIADCLNEKNGLPYLAKLIKDNKRPKFHLAFTDPPFNIDLQNNINSGKPFKTIQKERTVIYYEDQRTELEYKEWCQTWFQYLMDICDIVIVYCGGMNRAMWYSIKKPLYIFYLIKE